MATAIELDTLRQRGNLLMISCLERIRRLLHQSIQVVHVCLVVLAVMELHKLLGDDRLQSVQGVRQRLEYGFLKGRKGPVESQRFSENASGEHVLLL